jgi:hypothetical protein
MPTLAFLAGLAAYAMTLGTALRLGRSDLSMQHFVIEAEAAEIPPKGTDLLPR